ncbi:hypothetical protein, partial [Algoriphagus sp.]|uniref:hypothetical protein n=1 Tax=Algoriphagus sp. TaxID=1872435 RepID=UPI002607EECB
FSLIKNQTKQRRGCSGGYDWFPIGGVFLLKNRPPLEVFILQTYPINLQKILSRMIKLKAWQI